MKDGSDKPAADEIRAKVREHYRAIAEESRRTAAFGASGRSCCGDGASADSSCCSSGVDGLGCGNPVGLAGLSRGERVLDLGSGAGGDCFRAAQIVGPEGRVIGVDMTPEMVSRARATAEERKMQNIEFRLGEIERLPVDDASLDVVISNCVINLCPSKGLAFREAYRVLKAGGRLAVADIVAVEPIPPAVRSDISRYVECVSGAVEVGMLKTMLLEAGFVDVRIVRDGGAGYVASAHISARKPGGGQDSE